MKKQPLLWMTIAAALLSGCTGHREHHPQVTFTVDTVRTDTTASNPICLAEKYGSLLNERHPDLFAGAQGSISRSAFFNDSLTLTPETLHGMIQNTPCVESLVTSVGPDTRHQHSCVDTVRRRSLCFQSTDCYIPPLAVA